MAQSHIKRLLCIWTKPRDLLEKSTGPSPVHKKGSSSGSGIPYSTAQSHLFIRWPFVGWLFVCCSATLLQPLAASSPEEVFTHIYSHRIWGANPQGGGSSGGGSSLQQTVVYRTFLQDFLRTYHIRSVVDAGCGDWNFSKTMDWTGISYLGVDVVNSVIENNRARFETPSIKFVRADFLSCDLPAGDLLLCKDVLQHLPNQIVMNFMKQWRKFKYCLITNDIDLSTPSKNNSDIPLGSHRPLDLTSAPFFARGTKILSYRGMPNVMVKQVLLMVNE